MQQYEKHVEALLAAHKQQMDEYNKILFNDNLTIQEKQDQINLQSNIYGNKMGLAKTTFQEQVRMITQFGKMGTQLKIAADKKPNISSIVQERQSVKAQLMKDHSDDPNYQPTEPEIDASIKASKAGGKSGGRMFSAPGAAPAGKMTEAEARSKMEKLTGKDKMSKPEIDKVIQNYKNKGVIVGKAEDVPMGTGTVGQGKDLLFNFRSNIMMLWLLMILIKPNRFINR